MRALKKEAHTKDQLESLEMNNTIAEEQNGYSQVFVKRTPGAGSWGYSMNKSRHSLWTRMITNEGERHL